MVFLALCRHLGLPFESFTVQAARVFPRLLPFDLLINVLLLQKKNLFFVPLLLARSPATTAAAVAQSLTTDLCSLLPLLPLFFVCCCCFFCASPFSSCFPCFSLLFVRARPFQIARKRSVEHAQTNTMKVELCNGRISSQRLRDSSSSSSGGASEQ